LDVSAVRSIAANTEWKLEVDPDEVTRLAPARELARFDSDDDHPIAGTATYDVAAAGRFDGYLGWFEAQLSPSVTMTNDPWSPDRIDRWCNFYPVDAPIELGTGNQIELSLDIRPRLGVITWSTEVSVVHGPPLRRRGSTFHGSVLSTDALRRLPGSAPIDRTPRTDLMVTVLARVDGATSEAEIVDQLMADPDGPFVSRAHAEGFVRQVVDLLQP
jgi:hypothetical protein